MARRVLLIIVSTLLSGCAVVGTAVDVAGTVGSSVVGSAKTAVKTIVD